MALIAGLVLCLGPAPAPASTAQLVGVPYLDPQCGKYVPEDCRARPISMLVYQAGRGEANRVRIEGRDDRVLIRDLAATVQPGTGCSPAGRHRVSCQMPDQNAGLYVATGGRSDRVKADLGKTPRLIVVGGSGKDVLAGGSGDDQLFGGSGGDVLRGGGGADTLFDSAPRRTFRAGDRSPFGANVASDATALVSQGAGRDSYDGGKGGDTVSYAGRSAGVRVNLATRARSGGQRGERDSVRGVEHAFGGAGDDRLRGDRGLNELRAGLGDDRLAGGAGDDYLEGGAGRNVSSGGAGDDRILGSEREPERIACGSGADEAFSVDPVDFVGDDCEQLGFFDLLSNGIVRSLLPLREGQPPTVVVASVGCSLLSACQGRLELRVDGPGIRGGKAPPPGTLLGCQSYGPTIPPDVRGRMELSLGLSAQGLASLRRYRALHVRVSFTRVNVDGGAPLRDGYSTVLRAPRKAVRGSTRAKPPGAVESAVCG